MKMANMDALLDFMFTNPKDANGVSISACLLIQEIVLQCSDTSALNFDQVEQGMVLCHQSSFSVWQNIVLFLRHFIYPTFTARYALTDKD